eukprot:TRINITY_DN1269_c0_g3_i1.p1 TRINITY_DN1269_c0_g3~~TRINITY_DN1269_c0_g3_i1.p1  ORF type:complete len:167 (-),score=50.54 TRINITY_DN1269_c0_g3_i1:68-517(-)
MVKKNAKPSAVPEKQAFVEDKKPEVDAPIKAEKVVGKKEGTSFQDVFDSFLETYQQKTPKQIQIIDIFLLYILATGILLAVYLALAGSFPFNSFLSAFLITVGQFVLIANLRLQIGNSDEFKGITVNRAFVDFVLSSLLLHFMTMCFMG